MLGLIVLSHKYFLGMMSEWSVDLARAGCMGVCCYCVCSTMSSAIEFNGSFAYKYVMAFFEEEEAEKRGEIKKKIVLYIYYIWYHYFQFIIRLLLPLFLFLLVVTWKYLFFEHPLVTQNLQQRVLNPDFECPLNTNHLDILENAYRCPVSPASLASPGSLGSSISDVSSTSSTSSWFFLGGVLESIPVDLGSESIQSNMQKYPLLLRGLMV